MELTKQKACQSFCTGLGVIQCLLGKSRSKSENFEVIGDDGQAKPDYDSAERLSVDFLMRANDCPTMSKI